MSKAVVENFSFSVVKTEKVIKLKNFLLRVEPKFFAGAFFNVGGWSAIYLSFFMANIFQSRKIKAKYEKRGKYWLYCAR